MTSASTVVGATALAHGIHLSLVLLGLWGLAALLLPHALERRRPHACAAGTRAEQASYADDEHAVRVAELRAAAATGTLALPRTVSLVASAASSARATPRQPVLGLPLALVAGAAAAGIHAAVAPAHLVEEPAYGLFFVVVATVQVAWVVAASSASSRTITAVLRSGVALHGALVVLWLVTRLVGLPFGLVPERHPVGAWDLACVLWQLASIGACVRVLQHRAPRESGGWFGWHPSTRAAVGAAGVVIAALTLVGAHS